MDDEGEVSSLFRRLGDRDQRCLEITNVATQVSISRPASAAGEAALAGVQTCSMLTTSGVRVRCVASIAYDTGMSRPACLPACLPACPPASESSFLDSNDLKIHYIRGGTEEGLVRKPLRRGTRGD
jgi:hypothetical protein